ncbi:MAG: extracellular [Verrucomicrobiota bacterium]
MNRAASLLTAAFVSLTFTASAKNLDAYRIGDVAETDLTATVPLTVTDAAQTEIIRAQAAEKIPAVFHVQPAVAPEVEAAFQKSFADSRERFLNALEKKFHYRKFDGLKADEALLTFCDTFDAAKKYFPGDAPLYLAWARGEPGDDTAALLAAKLHETMAQRIRPNALAAELKATLRVKLLAPDGSAEEFPRAALVTLDRARTNLHAQLAPGIARYLTGFVRPNCTPDAALTAQARTAQLASLVAAKHFEPGEIIVHRGETITAQTKLALDELRARTPALASAPAAKPVATAAAPVAPTPVKNNSRALWLAGGVAVGALVLANLFLVLRRKKSPDDLALATTDDWRSRALDAERRADRATAMVRADLTTQIAKTLTHDLVKKIVEQRNDLLDTQQQAEAEMNALAARLENLDTPAQRQFYEQRIADLEKQLADKSAQNRALLEEQIKAARSQLAQSKNRMGWN